MSQRIDADVRARALLDPVWEALCAASVRLPPGPALSVGVADVPELSRLVGHTLVLSEGLEGPALHHPDDLDGPLPPLDRWRRASACVLEAMASVSLSAELQTPPSGTWIWLGACISLAHRVAPELDHVAPDLARAITHCDPGSHPRSGVACYQYWASQGESVKERLSYLLEGGVISHREWLDIGEWVLDSERGPARKLPFPVARRAAVDIPATLPAWSWAPLSIPAHTRGGYVEVQGDGGVRNPWGVADTPLDTLAAAVGPCRLIATSGGPAGSWEVASAQGFGQVMGARGVSFHFFASGRLEVVLADAFVGPLAAVKMAAQVGTSGTAKGRWHVDGSRRLRFSAVVTQGLTMHGRERDPFMMPARGFGIGEWLGALQEGVWWWEVPESDDQRMIMRGEMLGGAVEVRFKRVSEGAGDDRG